MTKDESILIDFDWQDFADSGDYVEIRAGGVTLYGWLEGEIATTPEPGLYRVIVRQDGRMGLLRVQPEEDAYKVWAAGNGDS